MACNFSLVKDVHYGKGMTLQVTRNTCISVQIRSGGAAEGKKGGMGGEGEGTGEEVHEKNRDKCNVKHDTRKGGGDEEFGTFRSRHGKENATQEPGVSEH